MSFPARYLGDQRFSYNQLLTYKLRIGEQQAAASILDIIIEGAGQRISAPFYSQGNPTPGLESQEYKFRLNEHPNYQWYPKLKAETFISILANITAIKIRATYNPDGKNCYNVLTKLFRQIGLVIQCKPRSGCS